MSRPRKKRPVRKKSLFDAPASQASTFEKADFLELLALREADKNVSLQDLIAITERADEEGDERNLSGAEADRPLENSAASALDEHSQRLRDLGDSKNLYPYRVENDLLSVRDDLKDAAEDFLYWFLLFATRLNMRDDRRHGNLDGAELFEHLCLHVAVKFFGGPSDTRVDNLLFGTARHTLNWDEDSEEPSNFGGNVDELCRKLGEGIKFRMKDPDAKLTARDDKLDVVVWRNFTDRRRGKMIAFGQCKTGSNWVHEMPRLNPHSFCNRWWHDMPAVTPIRFFFVADRVASATHYYATEAGVFFDRCRILEHCTELPKELLDKIKTWTKAAMSANSVKWQSFISSAK